MLLEEPGEKMPLQMHWWKTKLPHYHRNCPNCDGEEPRPFWYIGGVTKARKLVIVELTEICFRAAAAAAASIPSAGVNLVGAELLQQPRFTGLLVRIERADFAKSPRVLRCEQRLGDGKYPSWPYDTRRELARIWGIPVRPRLFKAEGEGA